MPLVDWQGAVAAFRVVVGSLDSAHLLKLVKFATGLTTGCSNIEVHPFSAEQWSTADRLMEASACTKTLRIPVVLYRKTMHRAVIDSLDAGLEGGYQQF